MRPLRAILPFAIALGLLSGCGQFDYSLNASLLKGKKQPDGQPNVASALQVTGPDTIKAGHCSDAITISSLDASGSAISLPSGGNITLSGFTDNYLTLYSDSNCHTPIADAGVIIPAGQSSTQVYARPLHTNPQTITITASSTGLANGSYTFSIVRVPDHIAWDSPPGSILANQCSSALTFRFYDVDNQPIAVSGTVPVYVNGAGGIAYTAGTCGAPLVSQGSIASLTVTDQSAGAFSLNPPDQAPLTLVVYTGDPSLGSDTITLNVGSSNPVTQLKIQALAGSNPTVGSCTSFRINAVNASGMTVSAPSAIAFTVSIPASDGTVGTSCGANGQASLSTSISAGTSYLDIYVTPSVSDSITITVAPSDAGIAGDTYAFVAGNPGGALSLFIMGGTLLQGNTNNFYTVMLRDQSGNMASAPQAIVVTIQANGYLGMMSNGSAGFFNTNTVFITIPQGHSMASFGLQPSNVDQQFSVRASGQGLPSITLNIESMQR